MIIRLLFILQIQLLLFLCNPILISMPHYVLSHTTTPIKVYFHHHSSSSFIIIHYECYRYLLQLVYPLYPWDIATACSLSTTQFADVQPDGRYTLTKLESTSARTGPPTPLPRALTLIIRFGEDGSVADFSVQCTTLKRPIRLTYEEVETLLRIPPRAPRTFKSSVQRSSSSSSSSSSCSVSEDMRIDLAQLDNPEQSATVVINRKRSPSNAPILGFQSITSASNPDGSHYRAECDSILRRVGDSCTESELSSTLSTLHKLARRRRRYREQRGCLDFSFAESRFHVTDEGVEGSINANCCSMKV